MKVIKETSLSSRLSCVTSVVLYLAVKAWPKKLKDSQCQCPCVQSLVFVTRFSCQFFSAFSSWTEKYFFSRQEREKVSSNLLFAWLVWCFLCLRYMFFLATFLTSNCKHRVLSSLAFYVFSVNPSLIPFSLNVHHRHNIFLFLLSCPSVSLEFPLFFVTLLLTHTKTTSPWSPNPQTERFHWHERIFLSLPD